MSSFRWLSLVDILLIPEGKEIVLNDDMGAFYSLLYEVGFDIDEEIDFESCYHRLMTNKEIVYAPRIVGVERKDKEWAESGYMTEEAWKISIGIKDVSLLRELEIMSRQSNFTGQLMEHLTNYWGEGGTSTKIEVAA